MKSICMNIRNIRFWQTKTLLKVALIGLLLFCFQISLSSQTIDVPKKLKGFEPYMDQILKEWNIAGSFINVELVNKDLFVIIPGQPRIMLVPHKPHSFRVKEFPDLSIVFITGDGEVTGFKQIDPSGEYLITKLK